jgi:hypothetical protein
MQIAHSNQCCFSAVEKDIQNSILDFLKLPASRRFVRYGILVKFVMQ